MESNCLSYSLRFWKEHKHYPIYYNSDHCVNLPQGSVLEGFLLIEEFGYDYFYKWWEQGLINEEDLVLLREYFR
jgi:hypothetical protein